MNQGIDAAVVDDTAADARRVVLFDFDGVIVRHQTLELFFRERLSGAGRWRGSRHVVVGALRQLGIVPAIIQRRAAVVREGRYRVAQRIDRLQVEERARGRIVALAVEPV